MRRYIISEVKILPDRINLRFGDCAVDQTVDLSPKVGNSNSNLLKKLKKNDLVWIEGREGDNPVDLWGFDKLSRMYVQVDAENMELLYSRV